ncbi:TPA: SNF2-related protein [Neisseria meningitidis]|uniref:SNF2-related protein n=1 Tax=Neisseria meningitidis TaxID=487 RepID=UPI000C32880A|nr:SNF2-related protein [Neisseria meningitidis]RQL28607.1 hypothetical protein COH33_03510 [Neisseria meningitidis]
MSQFQLTPHQARYYSWLLTRQAEGGSMDSLATTLVDAQVDLNPHQVDAALFACKNPLSKGVILADEVGLGKTIEAGLVILQHWAERKRKILIITPANLRKQWHQELQEKFGLQGMILEAKSYNAIKKAGKNPFRQENPVICSYQFAKSKADNIKQIGWDLVVLDEAQSIAGVTYLIKQGYDDSPDSDTCFNIRELVPLLACTVTSSDWQEYVIAAKSDKTRLFQQVALTSHRKKMKDAYQKLFSDSRTATEIWRIVQLGRIIKQIVKDRASGESIDHSVNLQAKDILNQGIWLIIHIVFLRTKLQNGNKLFITEDEKQRLSSEIDTISHKLVNVIQSEQWEKTAQAIFENQTDCNTIKNRLMAALASA